MSTTIVYNLKKAAGFFSEIFFMINSYIYSKKHNLNFILNSREWLFKFKNGWEDYFEPININRIQDVCIIEEHYFNKIKEDYPIEDYKLAIKELYIYNEKTKKQILEINTELDLNNIEYGSIFIRRGDKLLYESKLYSTDLYIKVLLDKYPKCNVVFVQTDDYTCVTDIENYIKNNNLKIEIITLCEKYMKGIFITNKFNIFSNINKNKNYINSIETDIQKYKTVYEMDDDEIYKHTIDMIIGVDILIKSKYCILDYQSNVSRFIKLIHNTPENVFDVDGYDIDMQKQICPAFPESIYANINDLRHA